MPTRLIFELVGDGEVEGLQIKTTRTDFMVGRKMVSLPTGFQKRFTIRHSIFLVKFVTRTGRSDAVLKHFMKVYREGDRIGVARITVKSLGLVA